MNRIRLALLTLLAPVLVVTLLVVPAQAHWTDYCGHGSVSHWGWWTWVPVLHKETWIKSWADPLNGNRHTHTVRRSNGYTHYDTFYAC